MKSFREQTYYELLEVRRTAPADEVRTALRRALDAYAPDSVALYALVEEDQAEALRSRLQEAARVLLDPAARAGYDRMLGLEPERPPESAALWAEDEEEDEAEGTSAGPYSRTEPASLERAPPAPPTNGAQASLKLDARPARWPPRAAGGAAAGRAPGLPSPTQRTAGHPERPGLRAPTPQAGVNAQPVPEVPPASPPPQTEERPRMPELPPDVEFNGELLRQVREARGLTLQQVAERTRIGRTHLERVEADRYADLPPSVYLRGILVSLARELKLDATQVSKSYLLLAARSGRMTP
jgi:Helix-turn-helix domain/DnaJ domain